MGLTDGGAVAFRDRLNPAGRDARDSFEEREIKSSGVEPREGSERGIDRMAREKKLEAPVVLFAAIEAEQHEALRTIAFSERRSLADVVRQAIGEFIARQPRARRVFTSSRERSVRV